ncbi:uncharacterized protein LOC131325259 [Rhododendron vialii]|uniref:uncharacterized protein LOC131325259 n=1 Tax=Rhododendron vialii TaxID=182163 RepID=UPI00265E19F7|nr:uncharacterized protein LOC131325259 [Rhododendron vialii]
MSMEEISEKWKALGDHAKRKYKKKNLSGVSRNTKSTKLSLIFQRLRRIQELDPLQVESVKAMGFGDMLQLKCTTLDRSLCEWLVRHFNPVSLCLHVHGKDCIITPLDMNHILGLSCGGQRVILEGEYTEIHELCLRHKVGDQGSISFDHLHNYLMNNKKADNDFKVSFVLYIMGTILCPTSEFGVNKHFLHALKDLSSVRELDWSQFVLKFLVECIQKYQKGCRVIRGCLLFLMSIARQPNISLPGVVCDLHPAS